MQTKKITMIALLSTCISVVSFAQQKPDFDKFKAEKIAFITQAIELTPQEAEKFWPVYNEFEKKKFELMNQRKDLENKIKNKDKELTDKEYADLSRQMASSMVKDGELMVTYNEEFLKILPAKKVIQLYDAEVNFRRQLLHDYRHKDENEGDKKGK